MNIQNRVKRTLIILAIVIALVGIIGLSFSMQSMATVLTPPTPTHAPAPTPTFTPTPTLVPTPTPDPTPVYPPAVAPSAVLGIVADAISPFKGIPWVRVSYRTCGSTGPRGQGLKDTIAMFHRLGVRVMLTICQWANNARLYDTTILNDAAQGAPDAVQCGNEQMKTGRYNLGVSAGVFAK
ncbi:MAG TPA: hypothetical protein VEL69_04350, partial [Ktedonobacteraceae bacterium]|nr:hypothetical protein [Ktedonobacteraceae bacterium]